jgi:hypothetical protein
MLRNFPRRMPERLTIRGGLLRCSAAGCVGLTYEVEATPPVESPGRLVASPERGESPSAQGEWYRTNALAALHDAATIEQR